MINKKYNGVIIYYKRMGIAYTPQKFFHVDEKKKFYEDCSKNIKDVKSSIWSDKSRTISELTKIVEAFE